jgi:hypothetical protein
MHPRLVGSSQITTTCPQDIHYLAMHQYLIMCTLGLSANPFSFWMRSTCISASPFSCWMRTLSANPFSCWMRTLSANPISCWMSSTCLSANHFSCLMRTINTNHFSCWISFPHVLVPSLFHPG